MAAQLQHVLCTVLPQVHLCLRQELTVLSLQAPTSHLLAEPALLPSSELPQQPTLIHSDTE